MLLVFLSILKLFSEIYAIKSNIILRNKCEIHWRKCNSKFDRLIDIERKNEYYLSYQTKMVREYKILIGRGYKTLFKTCKTIRFY